MTEICLRHNHPSEHYQATTTSFLVNINHRKHDARNIPPRKFSPETTNHDRIRSVGEARSQSVNVSCVLWKDDSSHDKFLAKFLAKRSKQLAECNCKSRGTITFTRHAFFPHVCQIFGNSWPSFWKVSGKMVIE